jgi:tetratricopeptide (TPR) repeat protein
MDNQIDYSGFIDRYLSEKMDKDELAWFRKEMESNPSLEDEVQMHREIGRAILNEETLEFRARIASLFEKEEIATPRQASGRFKIPQTVRVAVASLALLLMVGSGLFIYSHRAIPADRLFDMYYEPYDGLVNVRSSSSQMTDILVMAMQKYEDREFESALLLFETVLATDSENITSRFYSGISYLETERYRVAQKSFAGVIEHDDNLFIEHAKWYLGLCYLKTGDREKAKDLFTLIADSSDHYSKIAGRLLRNL